MKRTRKIILSISLLLTFSINSCFEKEKKPSYDELMEEHEKNKSEELFGMIIVGAIFCYIVYRTMKDDK
jgi:hypothetical protein